MKTENQYLLTNISNNEALRIYGGRGGIWGEIYSATIEWVVGEVIDGIGRGIAEPCKPCPCKNKK